MTTTTTTTTTLTITTGTDADIGSAETMADVQHAVDLFLSNHFKAAQAIGAARASSSPYHALTLGTVLAIQAVMTMGNDDAQRALAALDHAIRIATRYRRRHGLVDAVTQLFTGNDLDVFTANELHAELIWAEATLLRSTIQILVEQSFVNMLRSAVNVRTAYQLFRALNDYVQHCHAHAAAAEGQGAAGRARGKSAPNAATTTTAAAALPAPRPVSAAARTAMSVHFVSGVTLGAGGFDLILSFAPPSVAGLLQMVGFTGSRPRGLATLREGAASGGVQARICELVILLYRLILVGLLAVRDSQTADVDVILASNLERSPNGALYLYFQGKLDQTKRRRPAAISAFSASIDLELGWTQLHHICYWEAAHFAACMFRENKWSPAIYAYLQGSMLLMLGRREEAAALFRQVRWFAQALCATSSPPVAPAERRTRAHTVTVSVIARGPGGALHVQLPPLKQKILGKSLPPEKFVLRKGRKYFMQSEHLLLPAFEIMYTFGQLPLLGATGAEDALALIAPELQRLQREAYGCAGPRPYGGTGSAT